jgi:hypothetical protein
MIKTAQIKINRKINNQQKKFQSQQSNQQMFPTRIKSQNITKINNNKNIITLTLNKF